MANFNKIMLIGNLTRDPELSYLPSNTPVVRMGLASNRKFKKQNGEQGEETLFVDCDAFGRTAEVMNQYLHKGDPVFIEGRLKLDRWQDKDGNPQSKHHVVVENFQFLSSRGESGRGGGQQAPVGAGAPAPAGSPPPPPTESSDIPF